ncbi:hypothetical protein VCHC50A2_1861B, partial [Vibrio cholerae HC-50A2]
LPLIIISDLQIA